jgi:hypothetical protein
VTVIWQIDDAEDFVRLHCNDEFGYYFELNGDRRVLLEPDDLLDLAFEIYERLG